MGRCQGMPKWEPPKNAPLILSEGERLLREWHPLWTIERLLCHPWDAIEFCEELRKRIPSCFYDENVLLWTLLNYRKHGELNQDKDVA